MVAEMKNYAIVEGILSEIKLEEKSFVDSQGKSHDTIQGEIIVRVEQEVEKGEGVLPLEVPVRFWSKRYTNAGNDNPSFISIKEVLEKGKSIAEVGEKEASTIRVTGSRIAMQEYYAQGASRLISFPSINGSFVNFINKNDMVMKAQFELEGVIDKIFPVLDKDGIPVEPATTQVNLVNVGYGEYTHVIPTITRRADIKDGIEALYSPGDAIILSGKLNFTASTETYLEPVEIGDPIEKQRTVRVSELIIGGVAPRGMASVEYDSEDIKRCLQARVARLEVAKEKAMQQGGQSNAPRTGQEEQKKVDLGF